MSNMSTSNESLIVQNLLNLRNELQPLSKIWKLCYPDDPEFQNDQGSKYRGVADMCEKMSDDGKLELKIEKVDGKLIHMYRLNLEMEYKLFVDITRNVLTKWEISKFTYYKSHFVFNYLFNIMPIMVENRILESDNDDKWYDIDDGLPESEKRRLGAYNIRIYNEFQWFALSPTAINTVVLDNERMDCRRATLLFLLDYHYSGYENFQFDLIFHSILDFTINVESGVDKIAVNWDIKSLRKELDQQIKECDKYLKIHEKSKQS